MLDSLTRYYIDSETCGLHSMMVLFQYAENDGPIELYHIWKEPVWKTLALFEKIANGVVVGFNLSFDWFHVVKIYTIWRLLPPDWIPEEHIHEIAMIEAQGQDGPCIKPRSACDLLLHSRKNQYQTLMGREDIRIRRVPTALAYALADELEKRIQIDGIYFARSKDPEAPKWKVYDIFKHGELDPDLKDVVLKFNAAGGLKFLAEHALGYKPKYHFEDVELDKSHRPIEYGFAPTALAVSSPDADWAVYEEDNGKFTLKGHAWPAKIKLHIDHWFTRLDAQEYASDDIVYTRELCHHFGDPEPGDDDSVLACMVPVVRWRGFKIDIEGMKGLLAAAQAVVATSPVNINKPQAVREYLQEVMDDTEAVIIEETTEKRKLEAIVSGKDWNLTEEEDCTICTGGTGCKRCGGTGVMKIGPHPAAVRAKEILGIKHAAKEIELYQKLLRAGKFHAEFNVIGAMSSRMSGGGGLNAQGIKKTKEVRSNFPLAWDGYELCGGDFDAFEVTLADAVYNDPDLRRALIKGVKIHGLFGTLLFPGKTYEEILASDGSKELDMYTLAKSGVFAMLYGGNADTLHRNLGVSMEVATAAYEAWGKMFPGIEKARKRILNAFGSMKQPDGRQVTWDDPSDYCETFLGFRRYFTLENQICRELYKLGQNVPKEWRKCPVKLVRNPHKGIQTAGGAVSSALYGAAFGIQGANVRAAANHEMQSPGGQITKNVQRRIWDLQPHGVHPLYVAPMNIHDEIQCVTHPEYVDRVAEAVREGVVSYRDKVALIGMTWNKAMQNWAEKKGGTVTLKIKPDTDNILAA